jgi:hypothetical protein
VINKVNGFKKKKNNLVKMSSEQEQDAEINVVSSPECSPNPNHGHSHDNNNSDGGELMYSKKSNNNVLIDRLDYDHDLKYQDQASITTANTQKIIHNKTSAAYTSFSISSILSRNEPKKDLLNNLSLATANEAAAACYAQDSSMLSR